MNEYIQNINNIKIKISKNKIIEALNDVADTYKTSNLYKDFLHISAKFYDIEEKYNKGLVNFSEYSIEKSKTLKAFLDLIGELFENEYREVFEDKNKVGNLDKEIFAESVVITKDQAVLINDIINIEENESLIKFRLRMKILKKDYRIICDKELLIYELKKKLGETIFPHLKDQRYRWNLFIGNDEIMPFTSIEQSIIDNDSLILMEGIYAVIHPKGVVGYREYFEVNSLRLT